MSFRDIFGHKNQIEIFQKALSQRRIGHAYLFSGVSAIGKKTLAVEFAKAFNCENTDKLYDSCGNCISCRKIQRGSHPDFFLVAPAGQFIRIDAIREIQEKMKFKPLEATCRVFIIDDADKMNDQAANALLKTLEEPSLSNLLILITSRPYLMPPTIISRCLHVRFNPLRSKMVTQFLIDRMGIDEQKALLLAALSGGSIGRAVELNSEEVITFRAETFKLLAATQNNEPFSLIHFGAFLGQDKKKIKLGLDILNSFFRDTLFFKETGKTQILINQDKSSFVASMAARLSGEQILRNIALVESAGEEIERNSNKSLTLESMAFKLNY
ncbi:MAG: DNA polymerase III subunit delta' [Deltaproteobacteria bacterium RBG_16_44_11]|nr:MAG: DNA polymerase III subunit delta' [Deltaproteobacteria bacterium RBG_16_44_11]